MSLPARSLQGRLLLLVLSIVIGVWLSTATLTWFDARHELDELLDGHLAQAAALLIAQQAGELEEHGPGVDAPALHPYAPKVAFQVFHEGRLALRSANAPATPMRGDDVNFKTGFATIQMLDQPWRVFAARGAAQDVQVYVGEQSASRDAILWAVLRSTLWPMALALPLLALAAWWAIRRGMAPMRRLGRTLAERQPLALQPLANDDVSVEMRPMVDALNSLFERIAGLLESERRFTADAAHELRTPIAAIRMQAQVAMGEINADLRQHALQQTLDGCDRATRLVEQLLTLARLEAIDEADMAPVDLAGLTRRVVAELARKAIDKQQILELAASGDCRIAGSDMLLTVLVRNLIDNAVRYSPASARIRIDLRRAGGQIVLCVEDSGPGLPAAQRARLGERFFRVAGSGESGSGLGWSIVQRIAAVHGARLSVAPSTNLGGLSVSLAARAVAAEA